MNFEQERRDRQYRKLIGLPQYGDTREAPYCAKCYCPVTETFVRAEGFSQDRWRSNHSDTECLQNQIDALRSDIQEVSDYGVLVKDMPKDQLDEVLRKDGVDSEALAERTRKVIARCKAKLEAATPNRAPAAHLECPVQPKQGGE